KEDTSPAWLQGLGSAEPAPFAPAVAKEDTSPAWLQGLGSAEPAPVVPQVPAPPAAKEDTSPAWLQELGSASPTPPVAPQVPAPPAWLQAMGQATATSGEAASTPDEEMPPWLQAMVSGQAPNAPRNEPLPSGKPEPRYSSMFAGISRAEEQQANLPDWLKEPSQAAPAAAQAGAVLPLSTSGAEEAEIDLLLSNEPFNFGSATLVEDNASVGLPDWLQVQRAAPVPQFELPDDLPDWLKEDAAAAEREADLPLTANSFETIPNLAATENGDEPTQAHPQTSAGRFDDFNAHLNQPANPLEGGFLGDVEGPSWLRATLPGNAPEAVDLQATSTLPTAFGFETATASESPGVPSWLRTVGPATLEQEVPALPFFPAEPFIVPGSLPLIELPPQLASAAVLSTLLNPTPIMSYPAKSVVVTKKPKPRTSSRFPLDAARLVNYLLYLLLLGVTLFALLQPLTSPPLNVTQPVQNFYDTLGKLNSDSKVLIAYDWEGDRSGEMSPMAHAVTQHIMKNRARIVTFSLNSQGPALASQITEEVATQPDYGNSGVYQYGNKYLNLGWRPGNEAALRSLFNDLGNLNDYKAGKRANSFPVMSGINSINDFDAVVVLAGDENSVRMWIEQFGIQSRLALLYGTTAAVAPMARPYLLEPPSAQPNLFSNYPRVHGLLEGLNGTAQYQQLLKNNDIKIDSKLNLDKRLAAQTLAVLLLVLAVVVANVVYFVRSRE
ncbi:MAG: hypothetical protein WCS37_16080, partial [Chloroflexota bacterium]